MLKYLNNLNKSLDETRPIIYSHYIKWCDDRQIYDASNPPLENRVIFYSDKFKSDFKNPIVKECNGLVFAYNASNHHKWRIVSAPPECFNMNPLSVQKMNKYYLSNAYQIYEAIDGTMLTLYYFNGIWRMSSYKGYDVTFLTFCNEQTYLDIFNELVSSKYPDFSFDSLNKAKCYTVCMRYKNYHIFDETIHKEDKDLNSYIVFIQSVNLSKEKQTSYEIRPCYDENIGLPIQRPINISEKTITNLFNYAKQSYSKYEKDIKTNGYLTVRPLYGFILRSRNAEHEYRNIYIESSLMKYIRLALYNQKKNTISCDNKQLQLKINTFMFRSNFQKYYFIFPQFKETYEDLLLFIKCILPSTICNYIKSNELVIDEEHSYFIHNMTKFKKLVDTIIHDLQRDKIVIKNESLDCKSTIYDYIHSTKYNHAIYDYMQIN